MIHNISIDMKIILIIILMPIVTRPVSAGPDLSLSFKGGLNAATLAKDYRVNRYGISGGLSGHSRWLLTDRFSLGGQMDLLYSPRGAEVVFEGRLQGKFRQHYFDVTVAARPEMTFGMARFYLLLGGGVNFLASANKENAAGAKEDITDGLRRVDVALLAGAGAALRLPRHGLGPFRLGTVFIEGRHDRGLMGIDPVTGGVKNRNTSLMLGLSFPLSR